MRKSTKFILAMALVCFAIMAVNPTSVLANDAVELKILKKVKSIERIVKKGCKKSVPKTGQTTCYDETGTVIPCAGTGQDGDLQMGRQWPEPRFTDNGDGTVKDKLTGLIWLKDADRFGTRTWADALNDCNTLADDGMALTDDSLPGDWRLPNVRELESLRDFSQYTPCLSSGHPFDKVVYLVYYWSSTTLAYRPEYAWMVGMYHGDNGALSKSNLYHVWPVRGGYH